jgi:hypothetical protein
MRVAIAAAMMALIAALAEAGIEAQTRHLVRSVAT